MTAIDTLADRLPEAAKDLRLNIRAVLSDPSLDLPQRWGVALACAIATRQPALIEAVQSDATAAGVEADVLEDARAAAALMGMNNILYRFRHMVGEQYARLPARLRMTRIARPKGRRVDFELFSLAVSAVFGCPSCVKGHEQAVRDGGLGPPQVNDAIRIAATMHGVAVALDSGHPPPM